jgi:porphobilinogen synthase
MAPSESRLHLPQRLRRLRLNQPMRRLMQEHWLSVQDLVQPIFIKADKQPPTPIASMPGQYRFSIEDLLKECEALLKVGLSAIALFPYIEGALKDAEGSGALNDKGLMIEAIRAIKKNFPELIVIADVALDPYTDHGHDGVLKADESDVDNDRTVGILSEMAVLLAQAGIDWVAPSDMMDGRIGAIRSALDAEGFTETLIHAYAAKYASAYYGPFRDALGSLGSGSHKKTKLACKSTYQLNPANAREALLEVQLDEAEGADIVMIKPAGMYLDVIRQVKDSTLLPVSAYQVSGEYSQIHAAAQLGWLDLNKACDEALLAIKRAGADIIFTYFAKQVAERLQKKYL